MMKKVIKCDRVYDGDSIFCFIFIMVIGYSEEHNWREKRTLWLQNCPTTMTSVTKLRVGITGIWNFRIWSSPVHPMDSYGDDLGNHRKCQCSFCGMILSFVDIFGWHFGRDYIYTLNAFNLRFAIENVSALGYNSVDAAVSDHQLY